MAICRQIHLFIHFFHHISCHPYRASVLLPNKNHGPTSRDVFHPFYPSFFFIRKSRNLKEKCRKHSLDRQTVLIESSLLYSKININIRNKNTPRKCCLKASNFTGYYYFHIIRSKIGTKRFHYSIILLPYMTAI